MRAWKLSALLLSIYWANGCSTSRIADTVVRGSVDRYISESPSIKSKLERITNMEDYVHQNRKEMELFMTSLNYVNKVVDGRLERLEKAVDKILEMENRIYAILRKKKLVSMMEVK